MCYQRAAGLSGLAVAMEKRKETANRKPASSNHYINPHAQNTDTHRETDTRYLSLSSFHILLFLNVRRQKQQLVVTWPQESFLISASAGSKQMWNRGMQSDFSMWSIFLFDSLSVFYQNIQSELQQQRGGREAVAMATKAAAIVITRLLLHCVCVCLRVCVWTQRVWVHPPLFRQEARTSPSNAVPERKRESEREQRESLTETP